MVFRETPGGSSMNISTAVVPAGHVTPPPVPDVPPPPLVAPLPLPDEPPAPPPPEPPHAPPVIGVCVTPCTGSHASVVHALPSSTAGAVPAAQKPFWHVSAPSHTVALAQAVPSVSFEREQKPLLQLSAVQALPSLQFAALAQ